MEFELQQRGHYCLKCNIIEPAGSKFSQCSICKYARYCSKECQIAHWPFHKVLTFSNPQADCAKWKVELDSFSNPPLRRKFVKWNADNFTHNINLVQYLMHPINRIHLKAQVAIIGLKELPIGFRVHSAEAVSIERIPAEDLKKRIRDNLLSNQINRPEEVFCVSCYIVEAIDVANSGSSKSVPSSVPNALFSYSSSFIPNESCP
jgi:hypothetical protein